MYGEVRSWSWSGNRSWECVVSDDQQREVLTGAQESVVTSDRSVI